MMKPIALLAVVAAASAASGCGTLGKSLGSSKTAPDEFRVVTKAPLALPPDYHCVRRAQAIRVRKNCAPARTPARRCSARHGVDASQRRELLVE